MVIEWYRERQLRRAVRIVARHLTISYGPFEMQRTERGTYVDAIVMGLRQELQFAMSDDLARMQADMIARIRSE